MFNLIAAQATGAASAAQVTTVQQGAAAQMVPVPPISPSEVAAYIDPGEVARYLPPPPPTTELVAITDSFFSTIDSAAFVALTIVGFFLLARLLHAWMLHRSIRRAIEGKSEHVGAMIDKLNKPYEHVGNSAVRDVPGDDRNGLVLLAIGLAMAGFGVIQGHEQLIRVSAGAALFPVFVGLALIIRRRRLLAAAAEEKAAAQQ